MQREKRKFQTNRREQVGSWVKMHLNGKKKVSSKI